MQPFRHALYRLQNTLFALRRYVPGPLRQFLKPIYRQWWHRASRKKLAAALAGKQADLTWAGYAVICFSVIDWELRMQRPQQLLHRLAQAGHRIYYLRTDFQPGRATAPLEPLAPNVWGLRLPGLAHLNIYETPPPPTLLETWLRALDELRGSERLHTAIALVHAPFWTPLALAARERWGWPIVYDCLDEQSGFSAVSPTLLEQEQILIHASDLTLTTARRLYDKCAPQAQRCELLPNAADWAHFQRPSDRPVLADLEGPIIGYYGALADWFEAEFVRAAATTHSEWQFVLIGLNSGVDLRMLERLTNVHLLGEQPYTALPDYLWRFDAVMIPFKLNMLTLATNPVKFYEYLCAGKPVVATDLPELAPYSDLFYPAATPQEFVRQLEAALAERDPACVAARRAVAQANTWETRVAALDAALRQLYSRAAIIIVSYQNLDYLRLCLESIWAKTDYPNYKVIVVDNASAPQVVAYLQESQRVQSSLQVILNSENAGFARASNQGIAAAGDCEYVVLLNNDTVVTIGWLWKLARHLQGDPHIGMLGPATNWASNEARIAVDYRALDEMETFAESYTRARAGIVCEAQTLDMFCVALRREVIDQVGLLDEGYGLGMFEDDDYALRLRRAGYRLAYAQDIFVHHWGWASFGHMSQVAYDRLFEANRRRFEEKWGERWQRPPLQLGRRGG